MKIHSAYLEIICSHIEYLFRKISFVYRKKTPLPHSRGDRQHNHRLYEESNTNF